MFIFDTFIALRMKCVLLFQDVEFNYQLLRGNEEQQFWFMDKDLLVWLRITLSDNVSCNFLCSKGKSQTSCITPRGNMWCCFVSVLLLLTDQQGTLSE